MEYSKTGLRKQRNYKKQYYFDWKWKVVTSEIELAKIFNKYFVDIVPKLGIKPVVSSRNNDLETGNLSAIIKKYKNHSSIIATEKYMKGLGEKLFNFNKATNDIVLWNIQKLNTKKASHLNDAPIKYIRNLAMFLLQL